MRPIISSSFSLLLLFLVNTLAAQNTCHSVESRNLHFDNLESRNNYKEERETKIYNWINENREPSQYRTVLKIPVVVHIIYNSPAENISDEQIISQIEVLNRDFRAMNDDLGNVPAFFQPLIADVEMEFYLAPEDPDGNATTGVTRTFTNNFVGIGGTSSIHYTAQGGQDAWNPERYLNIWVAKFAGGIGGISSFPGIGPAAEDGIEINYEQFGTINVEPPFHLGRTLTHEIGHYFNLEHPWGPELNDCCADDFVDDTPETCETYIGECPTHPVVSCSMPDMFMNFMFYSNDACLNMFTQGQKTRMLATLNTMRPGLTEEFVHAHEPIAGRAVKIMQNPVSNELVFEIDNTKLIGGQASIYDVHGNFLLKKPIAATGVQKIDFQNIVNGVYLLFVENHGFRSTSKIIVHK
ncbi:MAG: M43 family zinc metalloprotease [Bacteroidota bacterium]